jgi:hypothetical protein
VDQDKLPVVALLAETGRVLWQAALYTPVYEEVYEFR